MELSVLFSSIAIIAGMVTIGALIARYITFTADSRQLMIMIIINVAMPCIILNGIFQTRIDQQVLSEIILTFFIAILLSCLGLGLGWLGATLCGQSRQKARELAILSGFGNTGFIGIPLCATLFGPKGALLAAVFDAGLDFTMWTVGVFILQQKGKFSFSSLKALLNIPMVAIIAGLLFAFIGFQPPALMKEFTFTLSNLASPLAMMYIGILMYNLLKEKRKVSIPLLSLPITLKLFVYPVVCTLFLLMTFLPSELMQIIIIQTTMPTLAVASILFSRYAADEEMGAMTTVFSTLLSLITIPFVVYFCSSLVQ